MKNATKINFEIGEIIFHNHILEKAIVLDIDPYFMQDLNCYDQIVKTTKHYNNTKPDFNMPWVMLHVETIDSIIYSPISSITKFIEPQKGLVEKKYFH